MSRPASLSHLRLIFVCLPILVGWTSCTGHHSTSTAIRDTPGTEAALTMSGNGRGMLVYQSRERIFAIHYSIESGLAVPEPIPNVVTRGTDPVIAMGSRGQAEVVWSEL